MQSLIQIAERIFLHPPDWQPGQFDSRIVLAPTRPAYLASFTFPPLDTRKHQLPVVSRIHLVEFRALGACLVDLVQVASWI